MSSGSRLPRIGDVIVETEIKTGKEYYGIVHDITRDKWGHGTAFITWAPDPSPLNYHEKYGYSSVAIHNLRTEFRVIRDGIDIP